MALTTELCATALARDFLPTWGAAPSQLILTIFNEFGGLAYLDNFHNLQSRDFRAAGA
jgi:hypothetical protein